MQQFKVGDRVRISGWDGDFTVSSVWPREISCQQHGMSICVKEEYFCSVTLLPEPQTVWAVCDEDGGIMEIYLREEYAENYIGNPRLTYTIRPFHIIPVNE